MSFNFGLCLLLFVSFDLCSSHVIPYGRSQWLNDSCAQLKGLFDAKDRVIRKITDKTWQSLPLRVAAKSHLSPKLKTRAAAVISHELNNTEVFVLSTLMNMRRFLAGKIDNVDFVRNTSQARMISLRKAVLREESEMEALDRLVEDFNEDGHPEEWKGFSLAHLMDQILEEVRDLTEDQSMMINSPTVEKDEDTMRVVFQVGSDQGVGDLPPEILVDKDDNQYMLRRVGDGTVPTGDQGIIRDTLLLYVLSTLLATVAQVSGLPRTLGCIVAGFLAGPQGLNIILNVVQVETLAEIGVYLIVFSVGLQIRPHTIKAHWRSIFISVPCYIASFTAFIAGLATACSMAPAQGLALGLALSFSNLPHRSLSSEKIDAFLLGQDALFGLVLCVLPLPEISVLSFLLLNVNKIFFFCAFVYFVYNKSPLNSLFVAQLADSASTHFCHLGAVVVIAQLLGLPGELASFAFGIIIRPVWPTASTDCSTNVCGVLQTFFGNLFYASLGLHLFAGFIVHDLGLTALISLAVALPKVAMLYVALAQDKTPVSVGTLLHLGSCSQLSLLVSSRAFRFNIVSKDEYLLCISVITFTLFMFPLVERVLVLISSKKLGQAASF